jgi:kanamycin nucleotidyltransferase
MSGRARMTHEVRWQLALHLCERMVATYAGEIIVGGVYGSTARGTDTEWSDLEMLFVVQDGCKASGQHFIYRGMSAGYRVYEQSKLEEILSKPRVAWPFHMGMLSVLRVLHGDPAPVEAWLEIGKSLPWETFKTGLKASLPELVGESYGRILSCRERGNKWDVGHAAIEVLYEMNTALCLLNHSSVTHDYYQGFVESLSFPKLPEGYRELVPALWMAREIDEIVPLAERLVTNFWRLLAEEGVAVADYHRIEDVPV